MIFSRTLPRNVQRTDLLRSSMLLEMAQKQTFSLGTYSISSSNSMEFLSKLLATEVFLGRNGWEIYQSILTLNDGVRLTTTCASLHLSPCVPCLVQTGLVGMVLPFLMKTFNVSTWEPYMWYQNWRQTVPCALPFEAKLTVGLSRFAVSFLVCHEVSMYM